MKFLASLLLISFAAAQSNVQSNGQSRSASDLCSKKEKQYGDNFISCSEVDWGVKPFSADYQPSNYAPMTVEPSKGSRVIKEPGKPDIVTPYPNDYPGIKNTNYFFGNDVNLAAKFNSAILNAPKDANTPDLNDWIKNLQPKTGDSGWAGKCGAWSAWSMDPQIQGLLPKIQHGIICNGVPFTKGELKEIITALYPEPVGDTKRFQNFYVGYSQIDQAKLEDANVALSKLGMLGQGKMGPAGVVEFAKSAKQNGKNVMMDRDPGFEIWNQPIQKIIDVAYNDDSTDTWEALSSAEFVATNHSTFLSDLATLESDLTLNLVKGRGLDSDRFCALRKQLGERCDDLSSASMTAQVDVVNRLKQSAYNKQMIKPKQDITIVKHEMVIEYGEEIPFASQAPDKTIVQSYTYTSIHQANADGSDGPVIRSQWSPPTLPLGQICANPKLAEGRNSSEITRGFSVEAQCANGKVKDPALQNQQFFVGAVPPHSFKAFKAEVKFDETKPEEVEKKKAYDQLLKFMATCEKFDAAVSFLKHMDDFSRDNVFSAADVAVLNKEYLIVKSLLDKGYAQSLLSDKYKGIQVLGKFEFN